MKKWFITLFLSFALLAGGALPCLAGAPTNQVRQMLNKVMSVQSDPHLQGADYRDQRREAIRKIIEANFRFAAMARESLGGTWAKLGASQRREFSSVFKDLFIDSYTRLVLDFLKKEQIDYQSEKLQGARAQVQTTIVRTNEEIPVDYTLTREGEDWKVQDVTIDGVSIVQNYKRSFARVIQRQSFKSLLQKMQLQQRALRPAS